MQFNNILVATDFSAGSVAALKLATSLARDSGAKLWIVHVSEPRPAYTVAGIYASLPSGNEFAESSEELQKVVPADPQVAFEQRLIIGSPAEELVKFAANHAVDLIVIGTHGRTGVLRLLMGSVAEAVLRHAECPVLTLRAAH